MSTSIVFQLVRKDFLMMRKMVVAFFMVGLVFIAITHLLFGRVPHLAFINLAFVLLMGPAVVCGIALIMRTIVMEKEKSTRLFIMSLPVTVKEFTLAKLLVNIPLFVAFWLLGSGVAFYFAFGLGAFPYGAMPFITMIFLGVLVAYLCILSTSLLSASHGMTVLANLIFALATSAYLWVIVYLDPIERHISGQVSVWNSTAIGIVITQVLMSVFVVWMTWHVHNKKRDFI